MTKRNAFLHTSAIVLASAAASLALSGCNKTGGTTANPPGLDPNAALALPLTAGPATPSALAPAAYALPAAPRPRVVHVLNRADNYAYVDHAYAMSNAIGQAPPDYGFDYQGVRPWVWRSATRAVRVVEPTEGGYRYYYYEPGASEPYLVRDPQYSYGFSGGELATVYDSEGRLLPSDYIDQRAEAAGRYLARARALYYASLQNDRRSVNAANWAERRAEIDAERSQWDAEQNQQDDWRAYHTEHDAEQRAYWEAEHARREQAA